MFKTLPLIIVLITVLAIAFLMPVDISILRPVLKLPLEFFTSANVSMDKLTLYRLQLINIKNLKFESSSNTLIINDLSLYSISKIPTPFIAPVGIIGKDIWFNSDNRNTKTHFSALSSLNGINLTQIEGVLTLSVRGINIDRLSAFSKDASLMIKGRIDLTQAIDINVDAKLSNSGDKLQKNFNMGGSHISFNLKGTLKRPIINMMNLSINLNE